MGHHRHTILSFRPRADGSSVLSLFDVAVQPPRELWSAPFGGFSDAMHGVKACLVDREAIALMEPSGRFVMLSLADGSKLIEEQLELEPNLQNIFVERSAEQDILFVNRPSRNPATWQNPFGNVAPGRRNGPAMLVRPSVNIQPVGDIQFSGRIYAFNRATHKQQWPRPVVVEQRGYSSTEPNELPVLTFLGNILETTPRPNGENQHGSVLCLDKRTGRVLYQSDTLPPVNAVDMQANTDDRSITVASPPSSIMLKFTNQPAAPEPPFQDLLESALSQSTSRRNE